ncbi:phospholipase-like protein [Tanacetum coccineum]|uniref:Phospholipase-like protein n=1 Tax=Tanacetum coccineum TaxID=301880 RepID=A0ABQ4XSB5_9ASTR
MAPRSTRLPYWTLSPDCDICSTAISVHPENNQFIILNDPHVIGTLDGSTRLYPSWNDVDWVFLPIHVAGNHWATGVIRLANSHFYVFDSMASEENKDVISLLIKCWTPVLNHILEDREGDVVLRQSYKPESYGKLYYACPKSKDLQHLQVILQGLQHLQAILQDLSLAWKDKCTQGNNGNAYASGTTHS